MCTIFSKSKYFMSRSQGQHRNAQKSDVLYRNRKPLFNRVLMLYLRSNEKEKKIEAKQNVFLNLYFFKVLHCLVCNFPFCIFTILHVLVCIFGILHF